MSADVESRTPPFAVEPGHTVRFSTPYGLEAGAFVRWKRGLPLTAFVTVPGRVREVQVPAVSLRPVNDGRMVRLRGLLRYERPVS